MKAGDLVKRKKGNKRVGLFMGFRISSNYEYAEVMWFAKRAPNGGIISSIQKNLIEVISESR
jgi:predicted GNAT superfamily acetyltransferase